MKQCIDVVLLSLVPSCAMKFISFALLNVVKFIHSEFDAGFKYVRMSSISILKYIIQFYSIP